VGKLSGQLMKSKRLFLESREHSDSYINVWVYKDGSIELKMADCNRTISWSFDKPGRPQAKRKIKAIKAVIDEMYEHLQAKKKDT
jgi:hypothetical protein